jgi:TolA-binding protein
MNVAAGHSPYTIRPFLRPPPATWRGLWQLPTFCAGVLAFVAVLLLGHDWPAAQRARAQSALRQAAAALAVDDCDSAIQQAGEALKREPGARELAGDFHYVLGSAYLKKAEAAGEDRQPLLSKARVDLDTARQGGVSAEFRLGLEYRLLRAEFLSGRPHPQLAAFLARNLEENVQDRMQGYAWLIDLHLNGSNPSVEGALRANERLLAQPNLKDANPVRLQRGKLLLQLQRGAEARLVLLRIAPATPQHLEALHLLGLSYFQDEEWEAAARAWEELGQALGSARPAFQAEALYRLGEAYLAQRRGGGDGIAAWERLCREFPGSDEAFAAALRLAEYYVQHDLPEEALRLFKRTAGERKPPYQNRYIECEAAKQIVEAAWNRWLSEGRFDEARQLSLLYRFLAAAGEAERRIALACKTEADREAREAESVSALKALVLRLRARGLYYQAGKSFEEAAALRAGTQEQGDLLWLAAEACLSANEPADSIRLLEQCLSLPLANAKRQEVLVSLGEAYHLSRQPAKAIPPLLASLSLQGPHRIRALYLTALARLDQGQFLEAEEALREILSARTASGEPAEYTKALALLGHIHYRRQQYDAAAEYLDKAAQRYAADDPDVYPLRFWLAEAWRMAARQEERKAALAETQARRDFHRDAKKRYLLAACLAYIDLVRALERARTERPLSAAERELMRDGRFRIGACWFDHGDYDEAALTFDGLARDYDGQVDALQALVELRRVYLTMQRVQDALRTLDRVQALLERLSDDALAGTPWTRRQWQDWLENARRNSQLPEHVVKP